MWLVRMCGGRVYGNSPLKMTVGALVTCSFRRVEPDVGMSMPEEWAPLAGPSLRALFLPSWLGWNANLKVNTLGRTDCLGREKAIRKQVFSKRAPTPHALLYTAVLLRNTKLFACQKWPRLCAEAGTRRHRLCY